MAILVSDEEEEMSQGFMGMVLSGQDPREAWEQLNRMVIQDAQLREMVRQLNSREDGRELLDDSRRAWRERGFDAPFDFLFDEAERR